MNVSEFNNLLKKKIRDAKNYEKLNDRKRAIRTWIKVSELTLKQSKNPNIDIDFRNYLIQKTRQIIDYVKKLKSGNTANKQKNIPENTPNPKRKTVKKTQNKDLSTEGDIDGSGESGRGAHISVDDSETEKRKGSKNEITQENGVKNKTEAISDLESEFENMPPGFQQITPPNEFKVSDIKTPLNEKKIREKQNQEVDMSIFQNNKQKQKEQKERKEILKSKSQAHQKGTADGAICFACGTKLENDQKICPSCGTKQKN
ncbi:MAG: hypothetical protein R6U96_15940 [Promethearchaeia archaeon]